MTADEGVEYGAHLPLIDLGTPPSLPALKACATAAARLGYRYLCANDHLVFGRPWLDGPTALAALIEASQDLTLVTTASLPVLRGPVQLARTLAAIDLLSGGRLVAGVGPGSSAADYAAAGISFQERWPRFDEAVRVLRALLHGDSGGFEGEFYSTRDVPPEPRPGPPIWVASWGSPAGLRRVARLGDGWLASAYNTTPDRFRDGLERLAEELRRVGRAPDGFPVAVATTWLHVTEDRAAAERVLAEVLAPMLHRPGRGPVLGSPAGRPGRGVRRAAGRVRGRGRAPRLRLAARRRAAPAGAVPRARRLPHLTTRNQRLVAWGVWVRQLPPWAISWGGGASGCQLPTTSPSR